MALELDKACGNSDLEASLIDLYSGRKDLRLRIIRSVDKKAFDDDPLRILRAFSFSSMFGFKIDTG